MKKELEKLWNEYFSDECSNVDSDEERKLIKYAVELHEKVFAILNEEQQNAVEKYVDALYDMEDIFVKKAFFKGCEFAVSFLAETRGLSK